MIRIAGAQERLKSERRSQDRDRPLKLRGLVGARDVRELGHVHVAHDAIEDSARVSIMLGLPPGTECQ